MHETELLKKVVLSFIDQVVVVTVAIRAPFGANKRHLTFEDDTKVEEKLKLTTFFNSSHCKRNS